MNQLKNSQQFVRKHGFEATEKMSFLLKMKCMFLELQFQVILMCQNLNSNKQIGKNKLKGTAPNTLLDYEFLQRISAHNYSNKFWVTRKLSFQVTVKVLI